MDSVGTPPGGFVWKDHSRYVAVRPVATGWLVLWGRYEDHGRTDRLLGNRVYADLGGARRRLADSVLELTRRPAMVEEALVLFDRFPFPTHAPAELPAPL